MAQSPQSRQSPQSPIYLDNAATTPVDARVVDAMLPYLQGDFGNPASSSHGLGQTAARAVERAREQVAALLNADVSEIAWTSGASESNNLALKGAAFANAKRGKHLVTVATEHKAVLDTVHWLTTQGYTVTILQPEANGLISLNKFASALRDDTVLASVMLVNNEIGVIQDVAALGKICRERGVLFHVDAAQATGKLPIDLAVLPVDLMSLTAHKTYGPKGIGALYVRRGVSVDCQMHGGGHERGLRSGTLATHQIVGQGECFRLAQVEMATEVPRIRAQRDRLWAALREIGGVHLNGDFEARVAHNLNISVLDCDLPLSLLTDVAISSASACIAGQASHVIAALGSGSGAAATVMRITVGRFNTDAQIDFAAQYLRGKIQACRERKAA